MKIMNLMGKPCPIPVIETKKALAEGLDGVLVKVDTIVAVQNLEKMAKNHGYDFSYVESAKDSYEVTIGTGGKNAPVLNNGDSEAGAAECGQLSGKLVVVIGRDTMGEGAEELGKILIKGFIYSLTELAVPPEYVIFLNSGAYLTSEGTNTIEDLKKLEEKGTGIFTCGTCANYYGLQDKLAIGAITDMYGITEKMASASNVINI